VADSVSAFGFYRIASLVEHMIAFDERNAQRWFFYLMETLPHDQFTRITVILWM
jgi:hypothetical protein